MGEAQARSGQHYWNEFKEQAVSFSFVMIAYTPFLKLSCFVLYIKIIHTFLKNNASVLDLIVQGIQI